MSANLNVDQIASHSAAAEVAINDAIGQLDAALTDNLTVLVDNTNADTLTADQLRRHNFFYIDDDAPPPTGAITITVPAISRGMFVVVNATAQTVTVTIAGQPVAAPDLNAGDAFVLHSDGTNVRAVGGGGAASIAGGVLDHIVTIAADETLVDSGIDINDVAMTADLASYLLLAGGTMTGDLNMSTGAGRALTLKSVSTVYSLLTTEADFWELTCDSNGANYTFTFAAASFAPGDSGTCELGTSGFRWEKLWTAAIDCSGDALVAGNVILDNQKEVRFREASGGGTNYVGFKAAAALGADKTYTLPSADGNANGYLMTDGAGTLSFDSPAYDFTGFFAGAPTAGELITRIVAARSVTMPQNLTGSQGYIATAATAQTDFDIQVNGVSKGTMRFAAAANTATFIFAASVSVVAGDLVSIVAPNPADASAANLSFCLKCTRTS